MGNAFVQFSDESETVITSAFGCAQDSTAYPNQAEVSDTDPRYQAFINPQPTAAQVRAAAAQAALTAGLAVTSTGTPAISGTYPLDALTQQEITSVIVFIQINGDFPGGTSTYPWDDISGTPRNFPNIAVFDEWATAIANYVAAIKLYGAGTPGSALPAASITIA
ncbi:MAG: hypothetical protein JWP38_3755 [Herbaspirillum sp.]|nr:hypothetical protein [Herbaspirillum sp.]